MRRRGHPGALSNPAHRGSGLRDRKRAETRAALTDSAFRLFAEKGYRATSVDEIAAAAEVSRSTFFRYFGSKEAVLFDSSDRFGEVFLSALRERPASEGPITAFEEALVVMVEGTGNDQDVGTYRLRERLFRGDPSLSARRAAELERWKSVIAEEFAARRDRRAPERQDLVAAAVCIATTEQIGEEWREQAGGVDVIQAVRRGFAHLRQLVQPGSGAR